MKIEKETLVKIAEVGALVGSVAVAIISNWAGGEKRKMEISDEVQKAIAEMKES